MLLDDKIINKTDDKKYKSLLVILFTGDEQMKVNLSVVLDAIEMADDNYTYFLDLETGESIFLADELITGLDKEGLEDEIDENPDCYLRLPTKFEIHEYHIMEEFIWTLTGEKAARLERSIQGRGAFRKFKDMVYSMGIEEQWYAFQEKYYIKLAIKWCHSHDLEINLESTDGSVDL